MQRRIGANRFVCRHLRHDRGDDLALPFGAADVALRVGIAHAGECERRRAVGGVAASRPLQSGIGIIDVIVKAQVHATQGIHDPHHAGETDERHMVHRDAGHPLHSLDKLGVAVVLRDGIDLHVLPIHGHIGVAGDGDER